MKYNPSIAYSALSWHISTFANAPEKPAWILELKLVGAIAQMFRKI
jgi:hypothetical protein